MTKASVAEVCSRIRARGPGTQVIPIQLEFEMRLRLKMILASWGAFSCALALHSSRDLRPNRTAAGRCHRRQPNSPVERRHALHLSPACAACASSTVRRPTPPEALVGTIPIVTDQFATITVVPNDELRRNGASTLGDLLFEKPGITGSSFAPGASSRPIIRGLDVNRVRIQENGIGANGASDLGEDHFVPVDPLTRNQSRGYPRSRYTAVRLASDRRRRRGDQQPHSDLHSGPRYQRRIPWAGTSVDSGVDGAALLDAGGGNFAMHADAFGRTAQDYRVPSYPYLTPPNPADAPNATQPGNFNGQQPNSSMQSNGAAVGRLVYFQRGLFRPRRHTEQCALSHSRNRW